MHISQTIKTAKVLSLKFNFKNCIKKTNGLFGLREEGGGARGSRVE